ncbi:MAG: YjbQ family protein [Chloroflexi bacterium]|nr:YjbQ family protein [Chloroflexota bacterium]
MPYTQVLHIPTRGHTDVLDLTPQVEAIVAASGIHDGVVVVFVPGSTAAITTMEYEPGCVADFQRLMETLAPEDGDYAHNTRWGDGNGYAHLRASLVGPSLSIPLVQGRLALGTWQQIVLADFDNRPRQRRILVQVLGD